MEDLVKGFKDMNMNENIGGSDENIVNKFLSEIENKYQSNIIFKLLCGYSGNIYLLDYCKDDGIVYILGAKNSKGRETYQVTINKKTHELKCNCKDFQFRSQKLNIVCKHIVFLVCKVGYILDANYFKTKLLNDNQYQRILNILDNNAIWNNESLCVKNINKEFKINTDDFNMEDKCPICYESYGDITVNICCPKCKNYIHKKCMDIWLDSNKNCVYCRSYIWENYVSDI
jgi:hypothetical protein